MRRRVATKIVYRIAAQTKAAHKSDDVTAWGRRCDPYRMTTVMMAMDRCRPEATWCLNRVHMGPLAAAVINSAGKLDLSTFGTLNGEVSGAE